MFKQKILLIAIITVISGLVAGLAAFYRQQQASRTILIDTISTITPKEQEANATISVPVDPMQFNQTLTTMLNYYNSSRSTENITCEADLNSTIIHCQVNFLTKNFDENSFTTAFIEEIQQKSEELITKQYDNKLEPHINFLSLSLTSSSSLPSNPYIITVFGLLVGLLISSIIIPASEKKEE